LVCSEFLGLLYFLSAGWCDWDYLFLFPFFFFIRSVFGFCVSWFVALFFFALICIIWIVSSFFFVYLFISFGEWFVFLFFCIVVALARRIPFKFGMPSRGPCGDPPRLFVSGVYFLCLF